MQLRARKPAKVVEAVGDVLNLGLGLNILNNSLHPYRQILLDLTEIHERPLNTAKRSCGT